MRKIRLVIAPMRSVPILLLCLVAGACSLMSETSPLEMQSPPAEDILNGGIKLAVNDSHFAQPIEITDLLRSPSSFTEQWMVCIRSATSDEARRVTYSVFYGTILSTGKTGYIKSRYSVYADNCATQTYHPYTAPVAPSAPSPSTSPEPKKHHRHQQ